VLCSVCYVALHRVLQLVSLLFRSTEFKELEIGMANCQVLEHLRGVHDVVGMGVCSQNPIRSKITLCSGDSRRRLKSSRESL
jgi:hypothetical protein